jgi:hypothetical protein
VPYAIIASVSAFPAQSVQQERQHKHRRVKDTGLLYLPRVIVRMENYSVE